MILTIHEENINLYLRLCAHGVVFVAFSLVF